MPITVMPLQNLASFAQELSEVEGNAARCLEFALLAAARPSEAGALRWEQVNLERAYWCTPRSQGRSEICRPLSDAAVRLLTRQPHTSELVFPNAHGGSLTPMSLVAVMKRLAGPEALTASLRRAFADWAQENTVYPLDVLRGTMGLVPQEVDSKFEQFAKPKRLAQGRELMNRWARQLSATHA